MSDVSLVFCKRHRVVVLCETEVLVTVGYCEEPLPVSVMTEITRMIPQPIQWEKISVDLWQERCTEQGHVSATAQCDALPIEESASVVTDLLATEEEAPITQLLHALLSKAILRGASDIHIDMFQETVTCRMRVDGELRHLLTPPKDIASRLVSRVKVMADLDIAQKRLPQDGRISVQLSDHAVDVRVATLPTQYGERVVLRLLDKKETPMRLGELGLPDRTVKQLQALLARPHGLLLVTGPTGSGKTTTLYAALRDMDGAAQNIMTLEDPVEYTLTGISQTPVNPAIGLGFSEGLRALLRQDPDVLMVGEIRDAETAAMAVQASLTGHLVLSTLHTNTAVDALVRCRELGVPAYLLATAVVGVLAQRLLRRLCQACMHRRLATDMERRLLGGMHRTPVWVAEPVGCEQCQRSGYQGRFAVVELISLDARWAEAIHQESPAHVLHQLAREQTQSLIEAAREPVLNMMTSIQEWLRLMPETSDDEVMHEAV